MIHHRKFNEWDTAIRAKLRAATFGPDLGMMYGESYKNPDTFVLLDEKDEVMGWALVTTHYFNYKFTAMFFTQEKLRRQGIGKRIAQAVKTFYPNPHVESWDDASSRFFKRVDMKSNAWVNA